MEKLPGFRDFYPAPLPANEPWAMHARAHITQTWRETAQLFGFQEYDGPPVEPLDLYTVKSGEEIVGQLYNFEDKGGRPVSLRPEMTPTLARMAAAQARNYKKPLKWFSLPQLFRYEKQQKGRLREHIQLNADIIGESDLSADAELIALMVRSLAALGLDEGDFIVRLSSRNAWQDFFDAQCGDPDKAYDFFQIVDKWDRTPETASREKLTALGFQADTVSAFLQSDQPTEELARLLAELEIRGVRQFVRVDYRVIRGLAYYTGPVFEAFDAQGDFRAIAGGGRYDRLLRLVSGGKVDLPALGFGMGDVVLTELLKKRGKMPAFSAGIEFYCLVEEESARADTIRLANQLRAAGRSVEYSLSPLNANKQFKRV